jgi:hypothetical protein
MKKIFKKSQKIWKEKKEEPCGSSPRGLLPVHLEDRGEVGEVLSHQVV